MKMKIRCLGLFFIQMVWFVKCLKTDLSEKVVYVTLEPTFTSIINNNDQHNYKLKFKNHRFVDKMDHKDIQDHTSVKQMQHNDIVDVKNTHDFEEKFMVHDTQQPNSVAVGSFKNDVNKTGWAYLEVSTNHEYSDEMQAYGAGVAEAELTKSFVNDYWHNAYEGFCDNSNSKEYCDKLRKFLQKNIDYMMKSIKKYPEDDYWIQVKLLLTQLVGLRDGLFRNVTKKPHLDLTDDSTFNTFLLQLSGDNEDLGSALGFDRKSVLGSGSCSALVKLLANNTDLYFAHDTWSGFETMLRILKKYTLNFKESSGNKIAGYQNSFSSYPGVLLSIDDFNLLSSGLASMETTIGSNNNPELWKFVTPETVLSWIRVVVANRLASTTTQWVDIFSRHNSGTYNNQWMILDYKLFTPGQCLKNGTFMVLEQMPGTIVAEDKTQHLNDYRYWPSYNIAFYPKIFNISHQPELVEKYGPWFSYEGSPRAKIFKRDHNKIVDMKTMKKMMRYNDFKNDEYSACNCTPPYSGENAIAARSDLNPANGTYPFSALGQRSHGATDMKLTNSHLFQSLQFESVCGPTSDQQPVFSWETSVYKSKVKHRGHPLIFNFTGIIHEWKANLFF